MKSDTVEDMRRTQTDSDGNAGNRGHALTGEGLIPKHGGYKHTKTWQLADLIYDVTVRFCDKFMDRRSRTHDQMVQAARSACQNLLEGSVDSAISKKIELKLTGIAKGSLEELRRDYQKFLQHHDFLEWPPNHPALMRFKALRCSSMAQFRAWVAEETRLWSKRHTRTSPDVHKQTQRERTDPDTCAGPCVSVSSKNFPAVCAANGVLSLLNLCIYLVGRQIEAQADAFVKEGGFTERLYKLRTECRNRRKD